MLIQTWGEVFALSLQNLWFGLMSFLPSFIFAVIIFILGWVVASVVGRAFEQVFTALKLDKLFASVGANEVFAKAGMRLNVGGFIGWIVKWFIVIAFLMASLEILELTQVTSFLNDVVLGYLPQVLVAALVLLVATVVSDVAGRLVTAGAQASSVRSAKMIGSIVRYAIWTFAFIIALSELGIAPQFMQILFTGIIAMLAVAGGIAFGLGGKEAAAKMISNISNDISEK